MLKSLFYYDFIAIRNEVMDELKNGEQTELENKLHSKSFERYLTNELFPYAPLWGSFGNKKLDSNAHAESYFKIVKKDILNYNLYQKPGRFIRMMHEYASGKINEAIFEIPKKPSSKKDQETAIDELDSLDDKNDEWGKKTKKGKNFFEDDIKGNYISL